MTLDVRRLGPDDAEPARQLGMEAFGVPSNPPTSPATIDQPGMNWYGGSSAVLAAVCPSASWHRGEGVGEGASIKVSDLVATNGAAYRALLSMIGSFTSVVPSIKIDTSGDDLAQLFLSSAQWTVIESYPY